MQVLFSLQSNAIKYTTLGSVYHTVDLVHALDGSTYLKISVKDSGLGIRDQDRNKLFKLFGKIQNDQGLN